MVYFGIVLVLTSLVAFLITSHSNGAGKEEWKNMAQKALKKHKDPVVAAIDVETLERAMRSAVKIGYFVSILSLLLGLWLIFG